MHVIYTYIIYVIYICIYMICDYMYDACMYVKLSTFPCLPSQGMEVRDNLEH